MNVFIIDNELFIRLVCFLSVFAVMSIWEIVSPRRKLSSQKRLRWTNNLALTILNALAVKVVFPAAAVGTAFVGELTGWGLFNVLTIPSAPAGFFSFMFLDLTIYTQHFVFHRVPLLWLLHRMHHADPDIDVTTGARFHTIEIIVSMVIKISVVTIIGAPAWSVLLFEIILNATSMFNHSNIRIPVEVDNFLRRLVVTPDMHRVHHSIILAETNSNFGFNFPWWDRIFRTYCAQPSLGHEGMNIGLNNFRDTKYLKLPWLLAIPFLVRNK
ncbi:MAG TPA: sterol desaturase family protein [Dissulfurispiraceae bacterium]|nr:sterol desaturase family protein [Dissulfurispiraceae bacterium]